MKHGTVIAVFTLFCILFFIFFLLAFAIRNDYFVLGMQQHKLLGITLEIEKEQEKIKVELEEKHGKVNIDLTDGSYKIIEDEKKSDKEKSEWGVVI